MNHVNKDYMRFQILVRPLFIALAFLLIFALNTACSARSGAPIDQKLNVSIAFSHDHLLLTNGNDFVWKAVSIRINKTYSYSTDMMPRGMVSLPLGEFRTAEGAAFNPSQSAVRSLIIDVQEGFNGKPGHFSW